MVTPSGGPLRVAFGDPEIEPSGTVVESVDGLLRGDKLPAPFDMSRWTVPPGVTSDLDQHAVLEIWMVRSGAGLLRSGDQTMRLEAGDAVLMPSWVPHRVTALGPDPFEAFSVWWSAS